MEKNGVLLAFSHDEGPYARKRRAPEKLQPHLRCGALGHHSLGIVATLQARIGCDTLAQQLTEDRRVLNLSTDLSTRTAVSTSTCM